MARGLFAILFPANCRLCQEPLLEVSRLPVCSGCLAAIQPLEGVLCSCCGERLLSGHLHEGQTNDAICGNCRQNRPGFVRAAAFGSYDGELRALIHLLKYDGVRPAARVLGTLLGAAIAGLSNEFGAQPPLVIPVPLHSTKLRQRSFNHSEAIAQEAVRGLPNLRMTVDTKLLIRRRATESQTGLTVEQRRTNVRGAFRVARPEMVSGRDVLLVDDVLTTGTTAGECTRMLLKAGAARVWVVTVARVMKTQAQGPLAGREERSSAAMAAQA